MQKHVDNNSLFIDSKGENLAQTLYINNQNTTVVSDLAKQINLPLLQIHITNHDKLLLLGDLARQTVEELAKNYKCCSNKNI